MAKYFFQNYLDQKSDVVPFRHDCNIYIQSCAICIFFVRMRRFLLILDWIYYTLAKFNSKFCLKTKILNVRKRTFLSNRNLNKLYHKITIASNINTKWRIRTKDIAQPHSWELHLVFLFFFFLFFLLNAKILWYTTN